MMRELLLPIVTAFVVGVMLSPIAKALETRNVPRVVSAALIVMATAMLIRVRRRADRRPGRRNRRPAAGNQRKTARLRRRARISCVGSNGLSASIRAPLQRACRRRASRGCRRPSATSRRRSPGFFIFWSCCCCSCSWWPDLRRQLVMTFASRDSRLTVLKILNETEALLATYLFTVTCINLGVGFAAALIAYFTGLPLPVGFGSARGDPQFHPDHRAHRHDRRVRRGRRRHRRDPRARPAARRAVSCLSSSSRASSSRRRSSAADSKSMPLRLSCR